MTVCKRKNVRPTPANTVRNASLKSFIGNSFYLILRRRQWCLRRKGKCNEELSTCPFSEVKEKGKCHKGKRKTIKGKEKENKPVACSKGLFACERARARGDQEAPHRGGGRRSGEAEGLAAADRAVLEAGERRHGGRRSRDDERKRIMATKTTNIEVKVDETLAAAIAGKTDKVDIPVHFHAREH